MSSAASRTPRTCGTLTGGGWGTRHLGDVLTTDTAAQGTATSPSPAPRWRRRDYTPQIIALLLLNAVALRPFLDGTFDVPALQNWATVFVSITVQALPFLASGTLVSGAVAAYVPAGWVAARLPSRTLLSVPVAGLAGAALPGCECGSVPIAGRLTASGVPPPAALAFMLSAPAINPVVVVATAVAFPGRPEVPAARFAAGLLAALLAALLWSRFGKADMRSSPPSGHGRGRRRWDVLASTARHDLLHAGGWLVLGSATAATLQTFAPRGLLDTVAGNEVAAVAVLAVLAVVLAVCSEADAFVAASLSQFSLTSRLVFMVVGPVVDLKLVALHAGTFGRPFASRFSPLAFGCAVLSALAVAAVFQL